MKFGRKLENWMTFRTKLVILDRQRMTFWTRYFLCLQTIQN